jgi:hypothetical protein
MPQLQTQSADPKIDQFSPKVRPFAVTPGLLAHNGSRTSSNTHPNCCLSDDSQWKMSVYIVGQWLCGHDMALESSPAHASTRAEEADICI